jgi:hypothetical protein
VLDAKPSSKASKKERENPLTRKGKLSSRLLISLLKSASVEGEAYLEHQIAVEPVGLRTETS